MMPNPAPAPSLVPAAAARVAALLAVDPVGCGGIVVRARAGQLRDQWLALLRGLLPAGVPVRRIPLHIDDDRLLGGLDLAATLQLGRPVVQHGVLAEADGGVVVVAMAERLSAALAARLAAALDTRQVALQRDGLALLHPARLGVVALDEAVDADEQVPQALQDRLGLRLTLEQAADRTPQQAAAEVARALGSEPDPADEPEPIWQRSDVVAARSRLAGVTADTPIVTALCEAALALGVDSVRAPWLALRVACAAAALDERNSVNAADAALAAQLVLAPRATRLPQAAGDADTAPPDADSVADPPDPHVAPPVAQPAGVPESAAEQRPRALNPDAPHGPHDSHPPHVPGTAHDDPPIEPPADHGDLAEVVLQAARASIPAGVLAALQPGAGGSARAASAGRSGAFTPGRLRGRPVGARRGDPRSGVRLNVIETLRAAAPWQLVRRRPAQPGADEVGALDDAAGARRVQVRRADFHVTRHRQRSETTTIFVVDASGSAALHRLAEAKGAVELLLADCYVRRDQVAVLAFRGHGAEVLLPPTRSLARAKRSLAGLPGGGGTPLAAGIDAALLLARTAMRHGATALLVLLTDGRANIARDGAPGRSRAAADALAAARQVRATGLAALLLDTSPQPQPTAQQIAHEMGARYMPLPHAGAAVLSQAVRTATASTARDR